MFSEETKTVIISLHDAGILPRHKLVSEPELVLRSLESNCEAEIRVVSEIGTQGDFHAYGVAFVHETLDFWKASFFPPAAHQDNLSSLALECSSCTSFLVLEHGDFEFDVCVIRFSLPTEWQRADKRIRGTSKRVRMQPYATPLVSEVCREMFSFNH